MMIIDFTRFSGIIARQRFNSIKKEIFRKSIHICSSLVPFFLSIAHNLTIIFLICAVVIYSLSEALRLKGIDIPLISRITETAARKRDENRFVLGPVTLVFGILIAAVFLPVKSAEIGIFALSFGDGFASLIGKLLGKVSIPGAGGKTVAGSLACFLAVYISTFCASGNCLISLLIAVCAMIIEVFPLKDFDNMIIPILIGTVYAQLATFL